MRLKSFRGGVIHVHATTMSITITNSMMHYKAGTGNGVSIGIATRMEA